MYRGGELDEFNEWLAAQGLGPLANSSGMALDEGEWLRRTNVVRDAIARRGPVETRAWVHDGKPVDVGAGSSISSRRAGDDPTPSEVVEVSVPMVLKRKDSSRFDGRFGVLLRRSPDGPWVYYGMVVRDVPPNTPLALPPV